jgi:hypothetical protein
MSIRRSVDRFCEGAPNPVCREATQAGRAAAGKARRRRLVVALAGGVTTLAVLATAGTAAAASFFSATGPWNAPIPANPALEASSATIVARVANTISTQIATGGTVPYLQTSTYSTPIWPAATSNQQIVIDSTNGNRMTLVNAIAGNGGVPFPAHAQPAAGTDGHITVYDAANHKLYEFWHASSPEMNTPPCGNLPWKDHRLCYGDGLWHADWGGIMDQVDSDPGFFSVNSWPGLTGTQGYDWGATATSLPLLGGLITFDDLNSGVINHAVAGSWATTCQSYFMAPAQRGDGGDTLPSCLAEGARLQLDPSYNVDADSNPPITKAIERAAQKYGIIVRDQTGTGNSFALFAQDWRTQSTNPYTSGPGVGGVDNGNRGYFGGAAQSSLLLNFPWSRLRVITSPHCTAAPCG